MTSCNLSDVQRLSSESQPGLHTTLLVSTSIALIGCVVSIVSKLALRFVIPVAWKCCLLCQDVAGLSLSLGLLLIACHIGGASIDTCRAGGFFTLYGVFDVVSSLTLMGVTFILIQNPSKMSHLSTFRWGAYLAIVIPQKCVTIVLSALPVSPLDYFDQCTPYPLDCFPIRQEGGRGATYGAILVFMLWGILGAAFTLSVVVAVRFYAGPGTRVHASSPSLWQTQKMEQGRSLHKFTMAEVTLAIVVMLTLTIVVYSNRELANTPQWVGLFFLVVIVLLHVIMSMVQLSMWSELCCDKTAQKKEPHHRLKQLELIRTEGPGKLRLKATWAAGKGIWKHGLLKVYGPEHIKAWAQEIVVLGLLRKSHSASVLQCLWTSNSNPYYETMTLISGNIVASDSRLTCLELTSCGTLHELLKTMDVPLPDQCVRTILHDVAEGLSYLHDQNVLHRNLTSGAVYLKGSIQCFVLRAAIGDFEDAQIYGTLLTGSPNSNVSRKRFFFPDIRAYALVGIELLARVCEIKQLNKHAHLRPRNKHVTGQTRKHNPGRHDHHHSKSGTDPVFKKISSIPIEFPDVAKAQNSFIPGKTFKADVSQALNGIVPGIATGIVPGINETLSSSGADPSYESVDTAIAEYNIDQNWKLQMRTSDVALSSDWRVRERNKQNSKWEEFKAYDSQLHQSPAPGVTLVKEAKPTDMSGSPALRAVREAREELDMIEEEIERGPKFKHVPRNGQYKQGGYVTSRTEDGREIFIPAAYRVKKSSAASSSGYGSGGGSTPVQSDHFSSAHADTRGVHKTTSAINIKPIGTDVVLPGMADDVMEKSKRGEELLNELLKAKQDARVEQLIESYDERVRSGKLGANIDQELYGLVFPKKKRKHVDIPGEIVDFPEQNSQNPSQVNVSGQTNKTLSAPRPSSSKSSVTQGEQASSVRLASSGIPSAGNIRSSLRRSKARVAMKKGLAKKNIAVVTHGESRGLRGQEVELKYANRQVTDLTSATEVKEDKIQRPSNQIDPSSQLGNVISSNSPVELSNDANQILQQTKTTGAKKQSTKSRPAPQPPVGASQLPKYDTAASLGQLSSFSSYDTDGSLRRGGDESSTTAEPGSTETESTTRGGVHTREPTSVEKIESDMNEIIHGNVSSDKSCPTAGVKLIDSGFDSASVSSEESCLCAAAALQVAEDGSCSAPSEIFSQGTCSCACSNCLGSSQGYKNGSSWTGSQDSESWSNSNSFSSYDANMYRRKLPRKRRESPGCVLAPDEQYPSPSRMVNDGGDGQQQCRTHTASRNHRRLSHTRGHYHSSSSETSSAASKRYRELIKKGVPLKVSVIPGDRPTEQTNVDHINAGEPPTKGGEDSRLATNNTVANDVERQNLLDKTTGRRYQQNLSFVTLGDQVDLEDYRQLSPIPSLEDIIKEIPDETGKFSDESRAFLNRPDSELSLKALQAVLSRQDSTTDGKQPTELMIDRIFTHQGPPDNMASNFGLRGSHDLDDTAIREVANLPSHEIDDTLPTDIAGLLTGMDGRHIRYCHSISTHANLVRMSDLLPANSQTFEKLHARLENTGTIGLAGIEILDLMRLCWLSDAPPTTTAILAQLTDPVMETEL